MQAAICAAMLALAGFASAMPQGPVVSVIRDDSIAPVGAIYRTDFALDNGVQVLEEGSEGVNGVGPDGETVGPVSVSRGSYSWVYKTDEEYTTSTAFTLIKSSERQKNTIDKEC